MEWGVDFTPEAERWFRDLPERQQRKFGKQVEKLRRGGPSLGRPTVDSVKGSRHHKMKELRLPKDPTRALFVFGPDQRAIVLVGGSKAGKANRWYDREITTADRLYTQHLRTFERGSACRATRAGSRSGGRSI